MVSAENIQKNPSTFLRILIITVLSCLKCHRARLKSSLAANHVSKHAGGRCLSKLPIWRGSKAGHRWGNLAAARGRAGGVRVAAQVLSLTTGQGACFLKSRAVGGKFGGGVPKTLRMAFLRSMSFILFTLLTNLRLWCPAADTALGYQEQSVKSTFPWV